MNASRRYLCVARATLFALALAGGGAHADYVAPALNHAPYGAIKVVVPVTTGDAALWAFKLRNVSNGLSMAKTAQGELQARVVLYGPGIQMLSQPMDPKLKDAVDALRAQGVQLSLCNVTLKAMNVDWHSLYGVQESDIVPSGFLEVGWLAAHGWGVDPAN